MLRTANGGPRAGSRRTIRGTLLDPLEPQVKRCITHAIPAGFALASRAGRSPRLEEATDGYGGGGGCGYDFRAQKKIVSERAPGCEPWACRKKVVSERQS